MLSNIAVHCVGIVNRSVRSNESLVQKTVWGNIAYRPRCYKNKANCAAPAMTNSVVKAYTLSNEETFVDQKVA